MSAIPEHWAELDSTRGVLYEIGWLLLAIATIAVVFVWNPSFIDITLTPIRIVGSLLIGLSLGSGVTIISYSSDRLRSFWSDFTRRFISLCFLIMGLQILLWIVPTWAILTTLAACVTAIPVRLYVYRRARSEQSSERHSSANTGDE